ncbi:hypothetical protein V9K67_06165 [Paraflavisolibacter sp. H34]|uniref:hypothetical protein n=1 Tax=Huijunlia imazamoxiresistens TaxID=3127457 RepID=UPI0030176394
MDQQVAGGAGEVSPFARNREIKENRAAGLPGQAPLGRLQQRLLRLSLFNFFLLAGAGLLLRLLPFLSHFPLEYRHLLHGHSHFAFGGWVLPVLVLLLLRYFPLLRQQVAFRHWRIIAFLAFVSAYGMLVSFSFQGYKAASIFFSTLSLSAGIYLAVVVGRALRGRALPPSLRLVRAGLFYYCLSALGPLATGPLAAAGKAGTPLYRDVIYFYLHCQYNGWFVLTLLAVLYRVLEKKGIARYGQTVYRLFAFSCLPAYCLSVLWHGPALAFYGVGGLAAAAQVAGLYFLVKDVRGFRWAQNGSGLLFRLAAAAFVLKNGLQLVSAGPAAAALASLYHNVVIAYLHLVLLGFVSLGCLAALFHAGTLSFSPRARVGLGLFLFSFVATECLLVGQAAGAYLGVTVPYVPLQLLLFSLFFPIGIFLLFRSACGQKKETLRGNVSAVSI